MTETKKTITTKTPKKSTAEAKTTKKTDLSVPVFDLAGKSAGRLSLPAEIFGTKVNDVLIAQAVRVYLTNQRGGNASTKTRGKVSGGGKKPFKQKGTGRARAGSSRSPIWVGGGTIFGPQTHPYSQTMPKKMKLRALSSALSRKLSENKIVAVKGLETLPAKTKKVAEVISTLPASPKYLIILDKKYPQLQLGSRNIPNVSTRQAADLTTYNLINNATVVLTAESLKSLIQRWN